jgi:hypothetical protein
LDVVTVPEPVPALTIVMFRRTVVAQVTLQVVSGLTLIQRVDCNPSAGISSPREIDVHPAEKSMVVGMPLHDVF